MVKIYIDFDGTLFNTDELFREFSELLIPYGISSDIIGVAMNEVVDKYGLYSLEKILDVLKEKYDIEDIINQKFIKIFSNKFVYKDVENALEKLGRGRELILLTYGDKYQWNKINCSGLKKYFSEIIVTDKKKTSLDIVDYKNSVFIDNRVEDLLDFYNAGAKKVIRIRRNSDKYSKVDTGVSEIVEYGNFLDLVEREFL